MDTSRWRHDNPCSVRGKGVRLDPAGTMFTPNACPRTVEGPSAKRRSNCLVSFDRKLVFGYFLAVEVKDDCISPTGWQRYGMERIGQELQFSMIRPHLTGGRGSYGDTGAIEDFNALLVAPFAREL